MGQVIEIEELSPKNGKFFLYYHRGIYFQVHLSEMGETVAGFRIFRDNVIDLRSSQDLVLSEVQIDLNRNTPRQFYGPVLSHEVSEAFHFSRGLPEKEAHKQAVLSEMDYAARYLSKRQFKKYSSWSKSAREI
jgi:hypothetical protein